METEWKLVALMCVAQFAMVFLKHINIRIVMTGHAIKASFLTLLIQGAWLASTAIGVKAVWSGDYVVVAAYLLSGMIGAYLNFKVKV